jgi:hypothetical protein
VLQQHVAPVLLEIVARGPAGDRGEGLGVVQLPLGDAVVLLDVGVRRVRALVGFEVELAVVPMRHVEGLELAEEVARARVLELRQPAQIPFAARHLEVDLARPASAVARAVDEQGRAEILLRVALQAEQQAVGRAARVVVALGRHVHEHRRAVDARPVEGAVGVVVELVPREFDGLEPVHAALLQDLRQCPGVAERVGQPAQPEVFVRESELPLQEPPADDRLPHERLATRQVGVGLDPERPLQFEASRGDGRLHPAIEVGMPLLHPLHLLRLGGAVDVAGPVVDRGERARVGARRLAFRLAQRP